MLTSYRIILDATSLAKRNRLERFWCQTKPSLLSYDVHWMHYAHILCPAKDGTTVPHYSYSMKIALRDITSMTNIWSQTTTIFCLSQQVGIRLRPAYSPRPTCHHSAHRSNTICSLTTPDHNQLMNCLVLLFSNLPQISLQLSILAPTSQHFTSQ